MDDEAAKDRSRADVPAVVRSPTRSGRPLDPALTDRLLTAALDVLATEGLERLTFEALAQRAGAGKAGIYRRWSSVPELVEHAMGDVQLVCTPSDHGSQRGDLFALLQPWLAVPDRNRLAAAALISGAQTHVELHRALLHCIVVPLQTAMAAVHNRERARGGGVSATRARLMTVLVQALWWDRDISRSEPLTAAALWSLIDDALLPVGPDTSNTPPSP